MLFLKHFTEGVHLQRKVIIKCMYGIDDISQWTRNTYEPYTALIWISNRIVFTIILLAWGSFPRIKIKSQPAHYYTFIIYIIFIYPSMYICI